MRAIYMIAMIVALTLIASGAHASAVLVDAKGDVKVRQGKSETKARIGVELADGAVVIAGDKSAASILSESGSLDEIAAGQSYTVGKPLAAKSTSLGSGIAVAMKEVSAGGKGPTVHGMVKEAGGGGRLAIDFDKLGGQGLIALYPSGTVVRIGPTIEFRWSEPVGKDWVNPTLALFDVAGKRVSELPLGIGDTSLSICPCKLGLRPGADYKWFLATADKGLSSKTHEFKFSTLSDNETRRLDNELSKISSSDLSEDGKALLDAQIYFSHSMYEEAVKGLSPAYARSPSPYAKKLLYLGYMRMGRIAEAKKYE